MLKIRQLNTRSASGFTLIEILFSIGILSLGMLGIGSLLPVAGVLQKETIDQIVMRQIVKAAKAVITESSIDTIMLDAIVSGTPSPTPFIGSTKNDKQYNPNIVLFSTPDGVRGDLRFRTTPEALSFPFAVDNDAQKNATRLMYSISIYDRTYPQSSPLAKREYIWEPVFTQNRQTLEWTYSLVIMKFNGDLINAPHVVFDKDTSTKITDFRKRKVMMRDTAEAIIVNDDFALEPRNESRDFLHGVTVPDISDPSVYEYNTLLITSLGSL